MAAVTKAVHARAPGLPIIPSMSAGATDSYHFRIQGVPVRATAIGPGRVQVQAQEADAAREAAPEAMREALRRIASRPGGGPAPLPPAPQEPASLPPATEDTASQGPAAEDAAS